jgi:hypothetical protein
MSDRGSMSLHDNPARRWCPATGQIVDSSILVPRP